MFNSLSNSATRSCPTTTTKLSYFPDNSFATSIIFLAADFFTILPNAVFKKFIFSSYDRGFFFLSNVCEVYIIGSALLFAASPFILSTSFSWPIVGGEKRPKVITAVLFFSSNMLFGAFDDASSVGSRLTYFLGSNPFGLTLSFLSFFSI